LKNVTITLPEDIGRWLPRQASEYWAAFKRWKEINAFDIDAEHRMTREEAQHLWGGLLTRGRLEIGLSSSPTDRPDLSLASSFNTNVLHV